VQIDEKDDLPEILPDLPEEEVGLTGAAIAPEGQARPMETRRFQA
jgi:hypothetical protein